MDFPVRVLCVIVAIAISGCANINSIHRDNSLSKTRAEVVFTDAKQRGIISNPIAVKSNDLFTLKDGTQVPAEFENQMRICSEAAPDVFSAFATSAAAKIAAKVAEKSGEGEFSLSSAENAATIGRTQATNTLRELMFRTCERFLNGAIDKDELVVQAARDQRVIVSALAIEQLTGVYTPAIVALNSSATSSTGGPTAETIKIFNEAQKAAESAQAAKVKADAEEKTAKDAMTQADLHGKKDCDEVVAATTGITDANKAKCKTYLDKKKAARDAGAKANEKKKNFEDIKKMTEQLGGTATSAGGSTQFTSAQSQAILSQNIAAVAGSVERIVRSTFLFNEAMMACIVTLRKGKDANNELFFNKCLDILDASVSADKAAAQRIAYASILDQDNDIAAILSCSFTIDGASKVDAIVSEAERASPENRFAASFREIRAKKNATALREYLEDEDPTLNALVALASRKVCAS